MNLQVYTQSDVNNVTPLIFHRKTKKRFLLLFIGIYRLLALIFGTIGLSLSIIYNSNIGIGTTTPLISYGFFGKKIMQKSDKKLQIDIIYLNVN
jgi:hypothetical protein